MAAMNRALGAELQHEVASTRKMLERVPDDRLDWKPHERSMTLGRLTGHIAELGFWGKATLERPEVDLAADPDRQPMIAQTVEGLLADFDDLMAGLAAALAEASDEDLMASWRLRHGERTIFELPRVAALRGFVLSHMIHHRGQLSVYLRLLDVQLPQTYGPSADEPGFSQDPA